MVREVKQNKVVNIRLSDMLVTKCRDILVNKFHGKSLSDLIRDLLSDWLNANNKGGDNISNGS